MTTQRTLTRQERQTAETEEVPQVRQAQGWRGGGGARRAALWLAFTRLRPSWRQLALVGVGVIVAVMMVCVAPLYTAIIGDAQIQNTLLSAPAPATNIEADITLEDMNGSDAISVSAQINSIGQQDVGQFISNSWEYKGATQLMALQSINQKPVASENAFLASLSVPFSLSPFAFDYASALPHMNILSGRLPQETSRGQIPEIMVTPKFHIQPDTLLTISVSGAPQAQTLVRVVGVWFPKDVNDPFWNGYSFDTDLPSPAAPRNLQVVFPILFAPLTFQTALNFTLDQLNGKTWGTVIHYIAFTNYLSVTTNTIGVLQSDLATFKNDLDGNVLGASSVQDVSLTPGLSALLTGIQQQATVLALPLEIVAGQVIGLALLFIAAMTSQLIEAQAGEIATLKSRGASSLQLIGVYLAQGIMLGVLAFVVGPVLASLLSIFLARTFTPIVSALSPSYLSQIAAPTTVLAPATVGALIGVATLTLTAGFATRLDVLAFRRAQARSGVSFWRRYYLDVLLIVLCLIGYFELGQFGGLSVRAQLGLSQGGGPDPLLLVTPGLLLLAGALVVLRLFPVIARLGAWLAARRRGAIGVLAFAQISRTPGRFSRLTLLLTLGVALGFFALTFQTSLAKNAQDRAAYIVGADERVTFTDFFQGEGLAASLPGLFAHEPGVLSATPIYRGNGQITDAEQNSQPLQTLAIDPRTFGQTAIWRSDYASLPLSDLLHEMIIHEQKQTPISVDQLEAENKPVTTSIYALVDQRFASAKHLRVGDRFVMLPTEGNYSFSFVVGAIINEFPTMYDEAAAGYIVVDIHDYFAALNGEGVTAPAPTDYLLRTTPSASAAARRATDYQGPQFFFVQSEINRRQLLTQMLADPLTSGMSSLLLVGALAAALLSALGGLTQVIIEGRRRATNMAILRTLGLSSDQLVRLLLSEQIFVYTFGLVGGALLGFLLSTATLPLLQYSSASVTSAQLGVPPYVIALNLPGLAIFVAALCAVFAASLALGAWLAGRRGLGSTLRLGED